MFFLKIVLEMLNKICTILSLLLRPRRRAYKAFIFISAVLLYVIFYYEELFIDRPLSLSDTTSIKYINIQDVIKSSSRSSRVQSSLERRHNSSIKYVLIWTPEFTPFKKIRQRGRLPFISQNCEYTNCFLTHKRRYLSKQTRFDAVLFSLAALNNQINLPRKRSPSQKYVVASVDPPQMYSVIDPTFENYFNWTWTYRLSSDILWRPFLIRKYEDDEIFGPNVHMEWDKNLVSPSTVSSTIEEVLDRKNKAVIWIIKDCTGKSNENLHYYKALEKELLEYGLSISTYSNCTGYKSCGSRESCKNMVLQDFYFYLAFETYIDEDYVTDILLMSVQSLAVPVVLGGADYTRFLPPSSYLDARKQSPKQIAKIIDANMGNFTLFQQYFWWVLHYYYEPISTESEICNICTALNDDKMVKNTTIVKEFRKTWNDETSRIITDFFLELLENNATYAMLKNGNYSEIRKLFKDRHFPDPNDSVFVFDMDGLNLTSTESTDYFMPDELKTDSSSIGDTDNIILN